MMKDLGRGLMAIGIVVAIAALALLTSTVSTEEMTALPYTGAVIGSGRFTETYNLPRAQMRELVFHGGCILFLAGAIFMAAGTIDERVAGNIRPRKIDPTSGPSVSSPERPTTLPFDNGAAAEDARPAGSYFGQPVSSNGEAKDVDAHATWDKQLLAITLIPASIAILLWIVTFIK